MATRSSALHPWALLCLLPMLALAGCRNQPAWTAGYDHWVITLEGMSFYYGDNAAQVYLFPETDDASSYGDAMLVVDFGYGYGYALDGRYGGTISDAVMEVDVNLDYPFSYYYSHYSSGAFCPFHISGNVSGDGTVLGSWTATDLDTDYSYSYCYFFYESDPGGAAEGHAL